MERIGHAYILDEMSNLYELPCPPLVTDRLRFVNGKWRVEGLCNIDCGENCGLGLSKGYDAAIAHLTYLVIAYLTGIAVNQPGNLIAHLCELLFANYGFEDAQLHRLAVTLQHLEEIRPRPIIRDIIHNKDLDHDSFAIAEPPCT